MSSDQRVFRFLQDLLQKNKQAKKGYWFKHITPFYTSQSRLPSCSFSNSHSEKACAKSHSSNDKHGNDSGKVLSALVSALSYDCEVLIMEFSALAF